MSSASSSSAASAPALEWLTQDEAAKRLGTTVRTIRRMASERKIASRLQPVAGRKPLVLIDPADIERILFERQRTVVMQNGQNGHIVHMPSEPSALALRPETSQVVEQVPQLVVQLIQAIAGLRPAEPTPWLTLKEAVAWSGLPASFLVLAAREGTIRAINVGTGAKQHWRFNRAGLVK
jgi:excisionase family DNA binding protein